MIREHQYRNDHQHGGPCTYKYYLTPCGRSREDHAEIDYKTKAKDQGTRVSVSDCCLNRRAFLIYVDLDPVPGTFHTSLSAFDSVRDILVDAIGEYNPVLSLFSTTVPANADNGRRRVSLILFVDLDPLPGSMYSQESAQNIIRFALRNRIEHYNPMVSLAPENLQPIG